MHRLVPHLQDVLRLEHCLERLQQRRKEGFEGWANQERLVADMDDSSKRNGEGLRDIDAMMMLQGDLETPSQSRDFCLATRLASSHRLRMQSLERALAAHEVWSIDPVDELRVQALLSVAQNLVSTPWLTQLLRRCAALAPSLELMLVGWASKPPRGVVDPDNICQTRPRVRISTAALEFVSPFHFVRKESGHYAALADRGLDPVRLIFGTNDEIARKRALYFERSCKVW
ncbi:hypothetical protein AK812_SmicGene43914 [Symbiodinium microadriaticum]|uniref:Uncharacterized protein n=1 Tax=Symbiodinium microadriaticum TaxID=2951 RepID=A0A1Q9BZS7_SYMMI|nr:hypothetical protein AK812_SmicGene43914 [Symbiodinium microadriaticum]